MLTAHGYLIPFRGTKYIFINYKTNHFQAQLARPVKLEMFKIINLVSFPTTFKKRDKPGTKIILKSLPNNVN